MQDFMIRAAHVMHPDLLFIIAAAGAFAFVVVHLAEKLFFWGLAAAGRAFWKRYHRPSDPACMNYGAAWPQVVWANPAHRGKSCVVCMGEDLAFKRADLEMWPLSTRAELQSRGKR